MEEAFNVGTEVIDRSASVDWCQGVAQRYRALTSHTKRTINADLSADMFNAIWQLRKRGIKTRAIAEMFGCKASYASWFLTISRLLIPEVRALIDSKIPPEERLSVSDGNIVKDLSESRQMQGAMNLINDRERKKSKQQNKSA